MTHSFQPSTIRPNDFETYWQQILDELSTLPIAAEEEELPLRSTDSYTTYGVHFTGLDSYRLFGYLSIPKGEGPFPALLNLPRYGSVLEIIPQGDANEKRERYLVFSPAGRGQRLSDRPYAASFPGMFLDGLEDPQHYIFRGFIADLCRAVDYVLTRPEVDQTRLAAVSRTDLPLLVAGLRPQITHLVAEPSFFYAPLDRAPQADDYPLEEINDYLRLYPDRQETIAQTLAYFDPLFFASAIKANTLLWGHPTLVEPLHKRMTSQVDLRPSAQSTYKDGLYQETWLAEQLGFTAPIVPAHWQ